MLHKKWPMAIALLALTVSLTATGSPEALRNVFENTVTDYVQTILAGNNDVFDFSMLLIMTLVMILAFQEIAIFMMDGLDMERIASAVIMVFATLGIWIVYPTFVDVLWEAGEGLSLSFQEIATGNRDPMFLSKWMTHTLSRLLTEDISLWTAAIDTILLTVGWSITSLLLQFVMYMVGMWAVWGLTLAKVIGVIFVPFLILPQTRSLFDGWLRFLVGFLVLLIILRITGVLAALTMQAQFESIGLACNNRAQLCIGTSVLTGSGNDFDRSDFIVTGLLAVLFVFSSFGFAAALSSGVGGGSNGITRSVAALAKKAATLLL
ncbi:hypothetical protein C9J12_25735 [Photobacterium frigidiphilum]|uniref:Conjugal transfer protein TrbL n=1 Tax=Photobacterium frigidiphilum TaxID=264736 RepID=A0A2T3J7Q4_9GAMM|nr:type IV secretion system protein [Photobacterium frigidiphilum]PSU44801.1 hypothetical protein C9J12_25735 [Photobacterium frigidiphilum]